MENNCKPKAPRERLLSEFVAPSYDEWRAEAERSLKGKTIDKLVQKTYENIDIKPIYTKDDAAAAPQVENQIPGLYPFARGTKADGYRAKSWEIVREYKYPAPERVNAAILTDEKHSRGAIRIHPDKTSILGLDPETAETQDFGMFGVSISSVEDLQKIFAGVNLSETYFALYPGRRAMTFTAMLTAYLKKNGIDASEARGAIEFDPFATFEKCGHIPSNPDLALDELKALVEFGGKTLPGYTLIDINAASYRNAGSSAVEELGFALSRAVFYLRELINKGVAIDEIASKIRFTFGVGGNFFPEIAKFRAARILWAKIIKEFGGSESSQKMKINAVTEASNLTILDAEANFLRITSEALSAVLGGIESLTTSCYTDSFGLPTDFARRISTNTQIILRDECNLTDVIDPAGGSYFVEALTAALAEKAWNLFVEIENCGGYLEALKSGIIQDKVKAVASAKIKALASRKDILVGSNKYSNLTEKQPEHIKVDHAETAGLRKAVVKEYAKNRDEAKVKSALENLKTAATKSEAFHKAEAAYLEGAMIHEVEAAAVYVTEKIEIKPVEPISKSLVFEEIRAKADVYKAKNGAFPKVFLANMGTVAQFKARADFSIDFLKVGGFESIENYGYKTVEDAAKAFSASEANAAVICSTDDNYAETVPALAPALKAAKPGARIILAGYPTDKIEEYKQAGVDDFLHVKANVIEVCSKLQTALNM